MMHSNANGNRLGALLIGSGGIKY